MDQLTPEFIGKVHYATEESLDNLVDSQGLINDADLNSSNETLRHLQFTADGTSLLSIRYQQDEYGPKSTFRTIVLPPDLLITQPPVNVTPFSKGSIKEPIRALAGYPFYSLENSHTTVALISIPDQPIRLVNTLYDGLSIVSSFPYTKPETETFVSPYSLAFTSDGTHFVAGADSEISVFDVSRDGSGPVETYRHKKHLPPGASNDWGPGRGIVSALDISSQHGILAAGTFNRRLGLYSSNGRGECITVIDLQNDSSIPGLGISQVQWSSCGKYLYVAERKSDEILIFDIRSQQKLLQRLMSRNADSNMRLNFDVKNEQLFAGGLDGLVRVWSGIGKTEGELHPSSSWNAHDSACSFILLHKTESVAVTGSTEERYKAFSSIVQETEPSTSSLDQESISESESSRTSKLSEDDKLSTSKKEDSDIKVWQL